MFQSGCMLEKAHQRARRGELEAEHPLVAGQLRAAADQVAQVRLGQLVMRQVDRAEALGREQRGDLSRLAPCLRAQPDEDVRDALVADAVVELGDAPRGPIQARRSA